MGFLGSLAKISGFRPCRRMGKLKYNSSDGYLKKKSHFGHKVCHPRSQHSIFLESKCLFLSGCGSSILGKIFQSPNIKYRKSLDVDTVG